jgi:[ribosomal protein S5]-alanine N-acetyltransferase
MPVAWETDRLLLQELGPEHAGAVRLYGIRSQQYQAPWDPARPLDFWELPVVAERLRRQLAESRAGSALCLCLSRKDDPSAVIGVANLRNIVRGALLSAHLGYALSPDAVGNGYMTEAVARVVQIAFVDIGLHRIECNIMPRNARSLAVAERVGFAREGFSPRYLRINGRWEDHIRLALLNEVQS